MGEATKYTRLGSVNWSPQRDTLIGCSLLSKQKLCSIQKWLSDFNINKEHSPPPGQYNECLNLNLLFERFAIRTLYYKRPYKDNSTNPPITKLLEVKQSESRPLDQRLSAVGDGSLRKGSAEPWYCETCLAAMIQLIEDLMTPTLPCYPLRGLRASPCHPIRFPAGL
jgi:hypothetical protein